MANVTQVTSANWVPAIWSKKILSAAEYAMVIAPKVNRDYEGAISAMGGSVNIPHLSNLTAGVKAVNTLVTFEGLTHGTTTLTINRHIYAAIQVERRAQAQMLPGYLEKSTEKMGYALARQVDTDLAATFSTFGENVGTLAVELTDNDYLAAWQALAIKGETTENSTNEQQAIFLSAQAYVAALKIDKFVNRDTGGENATQGLRQANVGRIYGATAYMSQLLTAASGGHHCAWIDRDAISLAMQIEPQTEKDFIIEQIADAVVTHQLYGYTVLTRPVEDPGSVATNVGARYGELGVNLKTV